MTPLKNIFGAATGQVHVSIKGKGLRVEKKQPISKEKFEEVKKDQNLQQVVELKIED